MLQRDYILRLIQLFFDAIAKFLHSKEGKDPELLRLELDGFYKTFLKFSPNHFQNLSIEEIIYSFNDEERLIKIEILAELFYQEAILQKETNEQLLKKSLLLLNFVDLNSDVFSIDRQWKINRIEDLLH